MPKIKIIGTDIKLGIDWHGANLFTQSDRQAQEASDHECRKCLIADGVIKCVIDTLERVFSMTGKLTVRIRTNRLLTVLKSGYYGRKKQIHTIPADNDYLYKIVLRLCEFTGKSVDVVVDQEEGMVTVTFWVTQKDIRHPSRYLEALARKMSKWAVA